MGLIEYVICAIAVLLGTAVGVLVGVAIRKKVAEAKIGSAEEKAKSILSGAEQQAASMKKEALIEAKEEILRQRNESERELKERRSEVTRLERRLTQKEENLDKKTEQLEKKNEQLDRKLRESEVVKEQIDELMKIQLKRLEEISGYSADAARQELFQKVGLLIEGLKGVVLAFSHKAQPFLRFLVGGLELTVTARFSFHTALFLEDGRHLFLIVPRVRAGNELFYLLKAGFLGRKVESAPEGVELLGKGIATSTELSELYHSVSFFLIIFLYT